MFPHSPVGRRLEAGFHVRYWRAILIFADSVGCRLWRNRLATSERWIRSTTRRIDCYVNAVASCTSRIPCSRNLRAHLSSGHVGVAVSGGPNAAPLSDKGCSAIWSAADHRPVLLGWRLGGCLRIGSAEALRSVSNVGARTWTWDCGGAGWPVRRPAHQGFASSRWLVSYGVRAIIFDQWVLGYWRGPVVAAPNAADSINRGLSLCCTIVGSVASTRAR